MKNKTQCFQVISDIIEQESETLEIGSDSEISLLKTEIRSELPENFPETEWSELWNKISWTGQEFWYSEGSYGYPGSSRSVHRKEYKKLLKEVKTQVSEIFKKYR